MKAITLALLGSAVVLYPATAFAQHSPDHAMHPSPQESPSPKEDHSMHDMHGQHAEPEKICTLGGYITHFEDGSGTSRLPGLEAGIAGECNPHPMGGLHAMAGDWALMAHGFVSAQYTDHSGPRGDDKFYVTSMGMLTGERKTPWGRVQLKSMFSLEPLMDARGYPNLFATGETADGEALVDRQHPHDLFMELAARVDIDTGNGSSVFLYGGPVGEPALGPSAFMHRGSAALNPEPPITHHWFDSTHITYGVVTAGFSSPQVQVEASAFRGAEPDEDRWDIEKPKLDSWSTRVSYNPNPSWSFQASYGEMKQPEALHPGEDERRFTASAHYANWSGFSGMLAFSSKKRVEAGPHDDLADEDHHGGALTAWLAEANWDFDERNTIFGRFENVANDELFPDEDSPLHEERFRVSKFQLGYARRIPLGAAQLAIGASGSLYAKPDELDAYYGENPIGVTAFVRLSLGH